MNEYGMEEVRRAADKNDNGKIDPTEIKAALAYIENEMQLEMETKKALRLAVLKESLSQGALMTAAVIIGTMVYDFAILFL